jgi:predicted permease
VRRNLQGVFVGSALEGMPAASPEDGPRLLAISGSQGFTSDYVLRSIGLSGTARRFSLLVILQAVFCILLLIVCLNVANLFIARAETRRYEMGVRLAMGAGRLRLIRQLLTESVLLALLGGGIGVVLAYWGKDVLRVFIQQNSQLVLDLQINPRILGFSVGVSLLTGIAFGLLPAFRATRMDVQSAVKAGSRNFTGSRAAIGKSLLVAQVAMSLVLLIGAGLLIRTLGNLPSQDVGYSTDKLLVFGVNRYVLGADRNRYEQIIEKIGAIPGVTAATASFDAFIGPNASFTSGNFRPPMDDQPQVRTGTVRLFFIRPNFFEVLGIPVLRGRGFDAGDVRGSTRVAVITESLARQFGTDPIGWRFGGDGRPVIEIVGVVKNVGISEIRNTGLTSEIHGTVFLPELQTEAPGLPSFAGVFSVRTATAAFSLVPQIRSALREIDPRLRAFDIATETQQVERKLAPTWRIAIAWSLFGGVALMLTSIGLYGLLSHSVARRTNELGIRIALGAGRYHVMRLVIGQTLFLVAIGLGFGLVASMILNQTIRALIYGVTFYDPPTVAMAIVVMLAVAGAATYLPARRAARVDPTVALRYE